MRRAGLIVLLLLCGHPCLSRADSHSEKSGTATTAPDAGIIQVKLGESATNLVGPWKFHTGDDMAWEAPDFDDSGWKSIDLTPPPRTAGVGWTRQGYPDYSGFAWYRLRVEVQGANHKLSLKMPGQADDAYQVYANGKLIGEFGKFTERGVTAYPGLPEAFPLPKGAGNQTITIAIRMWMDSATIFNSPDSGGLHGPPMLGYSSLIGNMIRLDYDDNAHYIGSGFLELTIVFMAL